MSALDEQVCDNVTEQLREAGAQSSLVVVPCRRGKLLTSEKTLAKTLAKVRARKDPRTLAPGIKAEIDRLCEGCCKLVGDPLPWQHDSVPRGCDACICFMSQGCSFGAVVCDGTSRKNQGEGSKTDGSLSAADRQADGCERSDSQASQGARVC